MFVVFGELFEGGGAVEIAAAGEFGESGEGGVFPALLLFEAGDIPEGPEEDFVAEIQGDGTAEKGEGVVEASGGAKPAGHADELGAMGEASSGGVGEDLRNDGGEAGEGEDVVGVVVEDGDQAGGFLGAEVLEVDVGDEFAGEVAFPFDAEDLVFELDEAATVEAEFPEAACSEEEVHVGEAGEGWARPAHAVAGFEERLVVSLAIVGDEDVELGEVAGQGSEEAGFFAEFAHEELADAEAIGGDAADSDEEGVGAGASGESGGFGVEEGPAGGRGGWDGVAGDGPEEIVGEPGEERDVHAAVAAMALVVALHLKVAAELGFDLGAGGPLFQVVFRWFFAEAGRIGRARGGSGVLAIDAGYTLPEARQLFLKVTHPCSPFLCHLSAVRGGMYKRGR